MVNLWGWRGGAGEQMVQLLLRCLEGQAKLMTLCAKVFSTTGGLVTAFLMTGNSLSFCKYLREILMDFSMKIKGKASYL